MKVMMRISLRPSVFAALLANASTPALAQQLPAVSQPVVQAIPGQDSQVLNAALARLGRDPRDINALIDAGNAALTLGDVGAAVGFFSRADQIQPNSPRVRAGLAGALVHSGNPYDAIPLFAEAEAAGGMDPRLNSERGLAYDLVGDNATAQKYYRAALGIAPSDETTRRLALSQAISGDRSAMDITLAPLISRGDKAAQRIRAFGLAIVGRSDDAVGIAYQTMPQDLAAGIAPYLRYMPRLTRAQQASAAMFGHFPRAAEIGHDDPRVLRFAPPVHVATAETALVPSGEPLGAKGGRPKAKEKPKPVEVAVATPPRVAPGELNPRREESETPSALAPREVTPPLPKPAAAPPKIAAVQPKVAVAAPKPEPKPVSAAPPPTPAPSPAAATVAVNTFDLGKVAKSEPAPATPAEPASAPAAAPPPVPKPAPKAEPAKQAASFAEAFGDLGAPVVKALPASGAVDVRKIAHAKPEPAKPVNPSRIWVQVGTGRDKSALGYTWRGLVKDNPEVLRGKSPAITEWGRTNRLLTGPFETEAAANAFLTRLTKADVDAFLWTSPAGQVVDPMGGR